MDWLTLTDLADEGSYARGRDYARRGLVEITSLTTDSVSALATGTSTYDVILRDHTWACTCPVGIGGAVCKHVVATALVASGRVETASTNDTASTDETASTNETASTHETASTNDTASVIATWLTGLSPEATTEVVRELAHHHLDAVEALARLAARASGDVTAFVPLVDSLKTRRHLDWRAANEHGSHAHAVVDELRGALNPSTAAGLLPLMETGIRHLIRAILRSDDSSGIQGDATERLISLHADAARLAGPDPIKLARWLVRMGVDEQDFFEFDVVRYTKTLGERGLATYRKELDKRLAKDPESFWARRGRQRLAVLSGDVAEIVRLVGGDLAGPHDYLNLVEALLEAGRPDDALHRAIEGLASRLVPHQTVTLYDVAVRLLRERGDHPETLRLRREQLTRIPNESSYSSLRKAAEHCDAWPQERPPALDILLESNLPGWLAALLQDGDVDLAWESSRGMDLDVSMHLTLARARAKTHPGDVFDTYVMLVDLTLRSANQQSYRQAVAHLGELRGAARAAGRGEEYADLVGRLLDQHRRRPTLVEMLRRLPT